MPHLSVTDLTMAYGERVIQEHLNFEVEEGAIFIIMGGSGCGKSTLLRHLVGLKEPLSGGVFYGPTSLYDASSKERSAIMARIGILYQGGALFSSMTLFENIALPLQQYSDYSRSDIYDLVMFKLSLVGLSGFEAHLPAEISGGMKKRAGLARAMALDPDILFFDEPSAGLDPISARRLDDLILELRASFGTTIVVVTHELASIFAIGTDGVFLDADSRTMIASGNPTELLSRSTDPRVIRFLTRGEMCSERGETKEWKSL